MHSEIQSDTSFPQTIYCGIMGHCLCGQSGTCLKSEITCYQNGLAVNKPNMSVEDFSKIAEQCKGKSVRLILEGRGDPDQHECFEEILKICHDNMIVPDIITSGFGMTPEIAKLCGKYCDTVTVSSHSRLKKAQIRKPREEEEETCEDAIYCQSPVETKGKHITINGDEWEFFHNSTRNPRRYLYSELYYENGDYTNNAINLLLNEGVKTNMNFVIGNNTIDELLDRFEYCAVPDGISTVTLSLYKPTGLGNVKNCITPNDERTRNLFQYIDYGGMPFKIETEDCMYPWVTRFCSRAGKGLPDTCEAGKSSCYIDSQMLMTPCRFDTKMKYAVQLNENTIKDAWNSTDFKGFRSILNSDCTECCDTDKQAAECPIMPEIGLR